MSAAATWYSMAVSTASRHLALVVLAGCGAPAAPADADADADAGPAGWTAGPALPEPVANNAVAAVVDDGACVLVSALGIDATLAAGGIHAHAFARRGDAGAWTRLDDVPGGPRIAASAVALRGRVHVLGGYTVAPGGAETSVTTVDVYDPATDAWAAGPSLPVAIDDAVAVAWRDRWIVVVSGWSNTAPVATVQLFDADSGAWTLATDFPGTPVFGHAGALVGDDLIVVDGVARRPSGFALVAQSWRATLDPSAPATIAWTALAAHPGPARYRAAAGSLDGAILIHGGTAEPYNFDGLGYDSGAPVTPLADTIAIDAATGAAVDPVDDKPTSTMDHRGLPGCGAAVHTLGGMVAGPAVTDATWRLTR